MDAAVSREFGILEDVEQCLLKTSNSSTLNEALQVLIGISKSDAGRSDLTSKGIFGAVLELVQSLCCPSAAHHLLLSLRLLRNMCAGEAVNQNLFIEKNGVGIILTVINAGFDCENSGYGIIRAALQILANVSLAGVKHQLSMWDHFFPDVFLKVAGVCRRETCDPLSMILYACIDGSIELFVQLCESPGLAIMAEIVRTASEVGFGEDWSKLLLSRICLEDSHLPALFTLLSENGVADIQRDTQSQDLHFTSPQAYLLRIVSEILSERRKEINVGSKFASFVLSIVKRAVKTVDFYARAQSGLPTGIASIDVLGYSLNILRDLCAQGSSTVAVSERTEDVVNTLVREGMLDLLLTILRELELPSSIRRTMGQDDSKRQTSNLPKVSPYKGFRRDIVAVIGNCSYRRKDVQDEVRQKYGVILLLQQCVLDEDNPFLREWGIWCARNLLEDNAENQQAVADLEMQGTVEVPELASLGLQVEVDPDTRRTKLVNVT